VRILALTHRLPYAPDRGDRVRAYHILRHLNRRADLELVSFVHDDAEASHAGQMQEVAAIVQVRRVPHIRNHARALAALAGSVPLTHILLDAPGMQDALTGIVQQRRPDLVFAYGSGMARFAVDHPLRGIPVIVDFVDMDSQKWRELAERSAPPLSWVYRREAKRLGAFEARAASIARANLVVNEKEAKIARLLAPDAGIHVIGQGVDLEHLRPASEPTNRPQIVFCGVMNYAPNHEGMIWFVRSVWPIVLQQRPDATLVIVGADPQRSLLTLAAKQRSITVTGRVPDVRPWLWDSAIGIAPIHLARGVQNKALEAIAAGLPIVITSAVAEGLPAVTRPAMLIADDPERFALQIIELLSRTAIERRRLAAAADLDSLTWPRTLEPLWPLVERAAASVDRSP
jgi:sugar transferase (PEP-CTERM/EpsH1 system associated)